MPGIFRRKIPASSGILEILPLSALWQVEDGFHILNKQAGYFFLSSRVLRKPQTVYGINAHADFPSQLSGKQELVLNDNRFLPENLRGKKQRGPKENLPDGSDADTAHQGRHQDFQIFREQAERQ
jgi:hypothetical protein